jgi:hypothetical protein
MDLHPRLPMHCLPGPGAELSARSCLPTKLTFVMPRSTQISRGAPATVAGRSPWVVCRSGRPVALVAVD